MAQKGGRAHSKIYWPSHCTNSPSGFIVGWNIKGFTSCVATIISLQLEEVEELLKRIKIRDSTKEGFSVLGIWSNSSSSKLISVQKSQEKAQKSSHENRIVWITVEKDSFSNLPYLKEIYCYGFRYTASSQFIFYSQSSPMHFFTSDPLPLAHGNNILFNDRISELSLTLLHINSSIEVESAIKNHVNGVSISNNSFPSSLSTSSDNQTTTPSVSVSTSSSSSTLNHNYVDSFKQLFTLILVNILAILRYDIPFVGNLSSSTSSGKQLEYKIEKLIDHLPKVKNFIKKSWENDARVRTSFVRYRDAIWMMIFDILLGIISSLMLINNSSQVFEFSHMTNDFLTNTILKSQISWLMGWPAGFKLNDNLDNFLGVVFLFYIDRWSVIINTLWRIEQWILGGIVIAGIFGGFTVQLAILVDIISFFSFHVTCFYTSSSRIYMLQLNVLSSLWKLFRGKKYNPLKQRIDNCDYDIDQLLLGTLLFTVFFFLLPTTMIYYLFFALVRLSINLLYAIALLILDSINHFPAYALFKYITDSAFLPGGIRFEVLKVKPNRIQDERNELGNSGLSKTTYLQLQNRTIPFTAIFPNMQKVTSQAANALLT